MTRLRAKPNRLNKNYLKRKAVSCLYENAWNCVSQTTGKKHLPSKAPDRQNMTNSFPASLVVCNKLQTASISTVWSARSKYSTGRQRRWQTQESSYL